MSGTNNTPNNSSPGSTRVLRSHAKHLKQDQDKEGKLIPEDKEPVKKKGSENNALINTTNIEDEEPISPISLRKRKRNTPPSIKEEDHDVDQTELAKKAKTKDTSKKTTPFSRASKVMDTASTINGGSLGGNSEKLQSSIATTPGSLPLGSTSNALNDPAIAARAQTFLEPIYNLRETLVSVLAKLPKPAPIATLPSSAPPTAPARVWGNLISQYANHPNVMLISSSFSIGKNSRCDLTLQDNLLSSVLCRLHHANGSVLLEVCSGSGKLTLNGRTLRKGAHLVLRSGDELSFTGEKQYSFIFRHLLVNPFSPPSSLPSTPTNTSNSNPHANNPASPPLPMIETDKFVLHSSQQPPLFDVSTLPVAYMTRSRRKQSSDVEGVPSSSTTTTTTTSSTADDMMLDAGEFSSDDPNLLSLAVGDILSPSSVPPNTPIPSTPTSSTPLGSPAHLSSSRTNINNNNNSHPEPSLKEQCKAELKEFIIPWEMINVSLDDFPYYLSKETKQMLISTAYLFLTKPEYVKFTTDLPSVSRRVLLEGPPGTELYQETLIKGIAKNFKANLLILDASYLENKEKSVPSHGPTLGIHHLTKHSVPPLEGEDTDDDYVEEYRRGSLTFSDTNKRRFKIEDRVKYVGPSSTFSGSTSNSRHHPPTTGGESSRSAPHRGPHIGYKGKVVMTFDDNPRRVGVRFDKAILGGVDLGGLCEENHGFFVESAELKKENDVSEDRAESAAFTAVFEILAQSDQPIILYIKDAEKAILNNYERYAHFKKELNRVNKQALPFLLVGSSIVSDAKRDKSHGSSLLFSKGASHHTALLDLSFFDHISRLEERVKETSKTAKILAKLLPNKINIAPPKDPILLSQWKEKVEKDVEQLKSETNQANLKKIMERNNIDCPSLSMDFLKKQIFSSENIEKIVGWAVSHHLMNAPPPSSLLSLPSTSSSFTPSTSTNSANTTATTTTTTATSIAERLSLESRSIEHGIEMLTSSEPESKSQRSLKEVETENEFEKRIISEVIPPNEIAIHFGDIGALNKVKETLKELVMLPLQRPELFRKGNLTKPCKGILLFGPPGTGKTMLAKAVATESGANFINVSMSTIGSKWFGEGEKYARAVFTLASKIAPSVIFIDEIDSILGKRDRTGEHEAMRKIKNEFMSMWDGLRTREGERVLVLGATNRPFDLDDAVLRRLSRRLMVDLPDQENRVKILQVILAKEDLSSDVDLEAIAKMTEGYSGSDLKNLSIAAAYQPIRELLKEEKEKEGRGEKVEKGELVLRAVTQADFVKAKEEVSASVSEDAFSIAELRKWNEMYGEGGSRAKSTLSYFV